MQERADERRRLPRLGVRVGMSGSAKAKAANLALAERHFSDSPLQEDSCKSQKLRLVAVSTSTATAAVEDKRGSAMREAAQAHVSVRQLHLSAFESEPYLEAWDLVSSVISALIKVMRRYNYSYLTYNPI